jgi:vancomycin permeability regulator SanA
MNIILKGLLIQLVVLNILISLTISFGANMFWINVVLGWMIVNNIWRDRQNVKKEIAGKKLK